MEKMIIALAIVAVNKEYATLLAGDLKDYSEKEKKEALQSLKEQVKEKSLPLAQRQWLLDDTAC